MNEKNKQNIRNFLITAHIDHGKSTLADRLLEVTGTIEKRLMKPQYLDQLELERERGITIKMAPVRMIYKVNHAEIQNSKSEILNKSQIQNSKSLEIRNSGLEIAGSEYILNLIDTPGHSDFSYEVSRALAAVEGAVLLVDATQGIQAQTLANFESAKKAGLKIIGAINKIDIAATKQIEDALNELSALLEVPPAEILKVSGKTGEGVEQLLTAIIRNVPSPKASISNFQFSTSNYSKALVFDSLYNDHKGVIAFVRVFDGEFRAGDGIELIAGGVKVGSKEIGYFAPQLKPCEKLKSGEIGYIATGIKEPSKLKIGDTIVSKFETRNPKLETLALPGYKEPKPVMFVSFYPEDTDKYNELKQSLEKLRLTDASLNFESDYSEVLGRGFKGGFLGKLHFEITAERLLREFNMATVNSFPSVAYQVKTTANNEWQIITNPRDFPNDYLEAMELMTKIEILTPPAYLGAVLGLKEIFRIGDIETKTLGNKVAIGANLPLSELIRDFDDKLKSVSSGFASLNYEIIGYEKTDVAKLDILLNGQLVPGLTRILFRDDIEREARVTVERLKELLPKQQFAQAIQAAVGTRIIARETIAAMRKDVTGYLYGGDRTRKMKLWKKQQRGKKKLKELSTKSTIKISPGIFKELLKK